MATTNGSTAIRDKILASLARYRALRIGKFPCAFWRLSARPGLIAYAQNPAQLRLPQMAGRLFGMQFLPPSRATSALRISELHCRLPGTKNHHSA
ncbi:hypothetical protein [Bathymodiolus japonicus methanotrophic gill symbiont]|uniref:hypothetical protein n=1 Tax=Bathymodiolus japonicus methanotrophic gill symbiont TaxID=113269 RepID=UPI001C8D2800|nr:hypothetical protein [Bathymodiolus japonicus methanotrophic gill symbiont]